MSIIFDSVLLNVELRVVKCLKFDHGFPFFPLLVFSIRIHPPFIQHSSRPISQPSLSSSSYFIVI